MEEEREQRKEERREGRWKKGKYQVRERGCGMQGGRTLKERERERERKREREREK